MTREELYEQFKHTKIQLLDEMSNHDCGSTDCTRCMFYNEELAAPSALGFGCGCICVHARNYLAKEARE